MQRFQLPSRYKISAPLGEGGSGRVYRVHDAIRRRELALKHVSASDSGFLRREFETLRHLRHEHLVQVFDWGALPNGEAYYTMELVEGEDWGRRMGQVQHENDVRHVLAGVLRGLAHLHAHRELHGDLKPGNVLFDRHGSARVSDVGMGSDANGHQMSAGTPGYAAPEIWEGGQPNERSDLYSVGVMAYEALAGRHPFGAKTIREVVSGQMQGWVPSMSAHGVSVSPALERAVMRSLDRDPALRQASADEFMDGIGVEDRVGAILGGRFVDRTDQLSTLKRVSGAAESHGVTLVYVSGEPGVGKSALVREAADAIHVGGGRDFQLDWRRGIASALDLGASHAPTAVEERTSLGSTLSAAAEHIVRLADETPTLLEFDPGPDLARQSAHWIRELARYIWAMARERNRPVLALMVATCQAPPAVLEKFEASIHLKPLERPQCDALIKGYLGRLEVPDELLSWLHSASGGNPQTLVNAIHGLIARKSLVREAGAWQFRETDALRALSVPSLGSAWAAQWGSLQPAARNALQILHLVQGGLSAREILELTGGECDDATLRELEGRGWLRGSTNSWRLASNAIAAFIAEETPAEIRQNLTDRVLEDRAKALDRSTRASLLLSATDTRQSLEEGMWAADEAAKLGQYERAIAMLERCGVVADKLKDTRTKTESGLRRGEALHQQGRDREAAVVLASALEGPDVSPEQLTRALRLSGEVDTSLGDLDRARRFFAKAIEQAGRTGNRLELLRAHSALAEIDWRHGDSATKTRAISRMGQVLESLSGEDESSPELASLRYQLGAALVVVGERDRGMAILEPAYERATSPYWRMRIANALASGAYFLGHFDEGLEWIERAWQIADQSGFDSFKARIHSNRAGILYSQGRFAESVESHKIASTWARRMGSAFEQSAAAIGASVDLILLADYEGAIGQAKACLEASRKLGNQNEVARAIEMEALARYLMGDLSGSEQLLENLKGEVPDLGGEQVRPRINWLKARVLCERKRYDAAEPLLREAEAMLHETRDWEDLPGVQIELGYLGARRGDSDFSLDSLADILSETEGARSPVVRLQGALAVGECLRLGRGAGRSFEEIVLDGLRLAEQSGAREYAWRLSFVLGELAARAGDSRTAQSRFAAALRIFREVADGLEPSNRRLYLGTAHGALLIERVASFQSP